MPQIHWQHLLAVAAGGAVGSMGRYLIVSQVAHWLGSGFPFGTLTVNVLGCTIMGVLAELAALVWSPSAALRAFIMVGVLGGLTTFSSFALDAGLLWTRNAQLSSILYVMASVALSIGGFFAGMHVIRLMFPVGATP